MTLDDDYFVVSLKKSIFDFQPLFKFFQIKFEDHFMIRFERSLCHWKALELGFQNMPKEPGKYFEKREKNPPDRTFKTT